MSDLDRYLGPEVVAAIEALVADRIAEALADLTAGTAPDWLTITEAAEYVRVSERTIERRISEGRLDSTEIGRRRLIRRADLDAIGERRRGRT